MRSDTDDMYFTVDPAKLREIAVELGPYGLRSNGVKLMQKALSAITLRSSPVAQEHWEYLAANAYLPCTLDHIELDRLVDILENAEDRGDAIKDILNLLDKHLPKESHADPDPWND